MARVPRKVVGAVVVGMAALVFGVASCGNDDDVADRAPSPTSTPTSGATPAAQCPTAMTLAIEGSAADFDVGWTGIAHDTPSYDGVALEFGVSCEQGPDEACRECRIDGVADEATGVPDRRCVADTSVACRRDVDCPTGRCADFFGPPLPLTTGGTPSCAMNEIVEAGPGSVRPAEGALDLPLMLRWRFYSAIDIDVPCPYCAVASVGESGVCHGGDRDGRPCVAHASHGLFRPASYDCPPSAAGYLAVFDMPLRLTTGTSELVAGVPCGASNRGRDCYCPGQIAPNDCTDSACDVGEGDEGRCSEGPIDGSCALEPFRGCRNDGECLATGDRCEPRRRECVGAADVTRGNAAPLSRVGVASTRSPLLVSTFCMGASSAALQNQALGLPGPGALRLPARMCLGAGCAP